MRHRRTLLTAGVTGLAMAVIVAGLRFAPAANADDPPAGTVLIVSPAIVGGTGTEVPFTVIQPEVGSSIVIDNPGTTASVTPQCVPLQQTAGVVACLGSPDTQFVSGETRPGTIPIVAAQENEGLPGESMDWVVEEAVSAVAAVHGVPADDMVRTYARPQIRSYVAMRLLNILNKKLYGVAMTPQETAAYDALQAGAKERLVTSSKYALTEYDKYTGNPCGYVPPSPPAGSGLPAIPNPIHDTTTCAPGANQLFKFSDSTPPVTTFDKWASYRHPTPSVTQATDPIYKSMTTQTLAQIATWTAIGLAVGASVAAGLLGAATLTAAAFTALVGVVGIGATGIISQLLGPPIIIAGTIGTVAAALAASVAVVLVAIVIAAVAIWQIVEEQAIGTSIRDRVTSAANNNDPLGIESRMADYAGLDIDTLEEPVGQSVARIHESDYFGTMVAQVNEWMMFSDAGDFLPDPVTGYNVTQSEDSDWHFVVNGTPVDFVTVLAPPGTLNRNGAAVDSYRVFFSRGWLMVSERINGIFGTPQPRLSLNYIEADGTPGQMSVLSHAEEGQEPQQSFQRQSAPAGELQADLASSWTYKGAGNVNTTATLVPNQPLTPPLNVIPTVQGELVADNLIELAAHVSDGADAGNYDWTVSRLDDNGNVVETIQEPGPNLVKYQTRLHNVGRYRAQVSYTTASETVSGTVEFELSAPEPKVLVAQIEDDRVLNGSLHLDLQLEQNVDLGEFDVTVEWADDARGNTVSKTYTVDCVDSGFDVCGTGPMILPEEAPTNANWSESPTFRIPDDQNFLPFVTVTITNGYGAEIKRVFPIEGEHRPRYESMTPYAALPAGGFSEVPLVQVFPSPLLVESQELTIQPYFGSIAAQLPEGVTVDLEKIGLEWWLTVSGIPQADAIGEYVFYVPFEQEPQGSGLAPPPALATLEIKAAVDPGYRAILRNTPTAFLDRQYRNFYPNYRVEVAQVLGNGVTDFSDFTGTVKCKLVAGPTDIFDKPCTPGATFPWPTERYSDTLTASVYLESATQPLSDDGTYEVMLGTAFVDPVVTVAPASGPNAMTTSASLVVWDPGVIAKPYSAQGYTVTCSRDKGAYAPCMDTGTMTLLRTPGKHTLDVKVIAPDDATTVQRANWTVATPAKTFTMPKFANPKKAGAQLTVRASGLLPQEKVIVKIAGIRVFKGKATNAGKFRKAVKIPGKLKPGKVKVKVIGATASRNASRTLQIVK